MDLLTAVDLIKENIVGKYQHKDYDRVLILALKYKRLITGEEVDKLLEQFVKREDDEMFAQRTRLTQSITPAIASSLQTPYYKVSRNEKIIKRIDVKDERRKKAIEEMQDKFYGNSPDLDGLDYYLQTRFLELSFCDPNAWIVVEFSDFDNKKKFPQPYPFEVSASEAINFVFKNEVLQWLLVRNDIKYKTVDKGNNTTFGDAIKAKEANGHKFTLYTDENALTYTRVDKEYLDSVAFEPAPNESLVELEEKVWYLQAVFEPKIGYVPAMRVGYKRDLYTDGRTYVNPLHSAMPFFMKSIKTVSELDLTMTLHAFPQKIQYVSKCMGTKDKPCNKGFCMDGNKCGECKGSGFKVHTSAQDAIFLPMPETKEDAFDLANIVHYAAPPTDLIQFQSDYVDAFEEKCHKAVFNSSVFVKPNSVATATEVAQNMDSVYDTLLPFAKQYSMAWKFVTRIAMILAGVKEKEAAAVHAFPADFKLKTVSILVNELKLLNDSGAPSFVIDAVNVDLATLIYSEDTLGLLRYKVKQRFFPFNGKTSNEIQLLISTDFVTEFNKVLYSNFELVFAEIDKEDKTFWLKTFDEQWKIVGEKVNLIVDDLNGGSAGATRFTAKKDLKKTDATKQSDSGSGAGASGNGGTGAGN